MNARTQITLDPEIQRQARAKAAELGISFAEYVRRLLAHDLEDPTRKRAGISVVFDLVDVGETTDVARDKDVMIGEAVWDEHRRKVSRKRRTRVELKTKA